MTYQAITHVTDELVERFRAVAEHPDVPVEPREVQLASPEEVGANATTRIALYPFRVTRDGSTGSMHPRRAGDAAHRDAPLSVAVQYLVTVYPDDTEGSTSGTYDQQRLLGLALQTLHDNSLLEPDAVAGVEQDAPIGVTIADDPLEQYCNLWNQFPDATYQPSVIVEVGPVVIRSMNVDEIAAVAERDVDVDRRPDDRD